MDTARLFLEIGEIDHPGHPLDIAGLADALAGMLPRGRLHILAGGGHTLNYSAPDQLMAIVEPFLNEDQAALDSPEHYGSRVAGGRSQDATPCELRTVS